MNAKNIFFSLIFFLLAAILPQVVSANPLWYGRVVLAEGDKAYLEWRDLENKYYFSCTISTTNCTKIPSVPDAKTSPRPKGPIANLPSLSDKTAGDQTYSSSKRFGAYVRIDEPNKARKIVFADGKIKKRFYTTESVPFWNLLDDQPRVFRFSADESKAAYVSDRNGYMSIYVINLKNLSDASIIGTKITDGAPVGDFLFYDKNTLVYVQNSKDDPYNWSLYSYNLISNEKNKLADNLAYTTSLRQSGKAILFNQISPLGTVPMILTDIKNGAIKSFTVPMSTPSYFNNIEYSRLELGGVQTIFMKNKTQGAGVPPLVIWLHGGPYRQASYIRHSYMSYGVYDNILEDAVSEGAYILKPDYAGSFGGSRAHTDAIGENVGVVEVKEIKDLVDEFKATHDTGKVYLVGNSYGGYLALRTLVEYPKLFAGALSINGVTDWASLTEHLSTSPFNQYFNGLENAKNKYLYDQASILERIENIGKQKIYIIQAAADKTVAPFQAPLLKSALDEKNKKSTLIMIPDEDHVFSKNTSINTICKNLFEMTGLDVSGRCALGK